MIQRIVCPVQEPETFDIAACFRCKYYEITIGGKTETPKCRKNRSHQHRTAFEMAILTNKLGFPDEVIVEATEEPKDKKG